MSLEDAERQLTRTFTQMGDVLRGYSVMRKGIKRARTDLAAVIGVSDRTRLFDEADAQFNLALEALDKSRDSFALIMAKTQSLAHRIREGRLS